MGSQRSAKHDEEVQIQDTLVAINDITLKIRNELLLIEKLVKENGDLDAAVGTANKAMFKQLQEMGINIEQLVSEIENTGKLRQDFLGGITSIDVTEKLLKQMDSLDV